MTKLAPYPEYKDSGVEWFPRLPVSWSATKLKHISKCLPGGTPDTSVDDYWRTDGSGSPWVSIGDMSGRQIISTTAKSLTKEALASKPLPIGKPGTLLFAMYASVGEVTPLGIHASWNQALLGIEARPAADTRFLYYALQSIRGWLPALYRSNTQNNLNADQVGNFDIPLPPLETQKAISAYLDRETAKTDDLIAKQERLIDLLAEKRQAIITQAVTKGLDTTAPTKPSGIRWIGEVPDSWIVSSVKREWTVIDCKHITADFVDEGVPLASIREVQGKFVNLNTAKFTTMAFYRSMTEGNREPKAGDLIFSRNATVGEIAIVPSASVAFAMGQDVCLLKRRSAATSSDFGWYAMRSRYIQEQISLAMIGSTFKRINVEEIRSLSYCAPPPDEQRAIAKHLDERGSVIDKAVSTAAAAIGLLRERRSALISAAVTGNLRVS